MYKNTDDWSGHTLICLREETLYLRLFNQLKQTQSNLMIYIHDQYFYKWAFTWAFQFGSFWTHC